MVWTLPILATLIIGSFLYAISVKLSLTNTPKCLFALGCLLAVYLLYLTACAAIITPGFALYVLPFFGRLNTNGLGLLINICGGLALTVWSLWAISWCRCCYFGHDRIHK